jgi:hypothetical protein
MATKQIEINPNTLKYIFLELADMEGCIQTTIEDIDQLKTELYEQTFMRREIMEELQAHLNYKS